MRSPLFSKQCRPLRLLKADPTLSPAWVNVLGNAMLAYSVADPDACGAELGKVWKTVWPFLESNNAATRKAAAESLGLLSQCFTSALISLAIQRGGDWRGGTEVCFGHHISNNKALDSLAFARSIPELLSVISSLITNLRYTMMGTAEANSSCQSFATSSYPKIGDLRTQKNFEHKEAADATLATAIRVLGPEVISCKSFLSISNLPIGKQCPSGHPPVLTSSD
jgi:ribosomal RNA-processing protein 12